VLFVLWKALDDDDDDESAPTWFESVWNYGVEAIDY
jgi:hypothetical protein